MFRIMLICILLAGIGLDELPAWSATLTARSSLTDLRVLALESNDALLASKEQWRAAEERVGSAGVLPDLKLGLGFMISPVETRVGPQRQVVSISQAMPWFGTLGARTEKARHESAILGKMHRARELDVLAEVDADWAELAWLDVAESVTREHLDLMTSWEAVARARYAAGRGEYADVIRAQVEMGVLENRRRELEERKPTLQARLAAVVGLDALPEGWRAGPLSYTLEDMSGVGFDATSSPDIAALDFASDSAHSMSDLARLRGRPNLTFGVDWIWTDPADMAVVDSGRDPLVARISLTLPLWRGAVNAGRREAAAVVEEIGHRRLSTHRRLEADLRDALFRYHDAARRLDLYNGDLTPRTEQALAAIQAAYEAGRAGFGDVLDIQRQLLEFTTAAARAAADGVVQRARIERITGRTVQRSES